MKNAYVVWGSLGLIALGVWRIILPYAAGYTDHTFAHWNDVIGGAIVVVLGAWSAVDSGARDHLWGTIRKTAPTLGVVAVGLYSLIVCFTLLYHSIGRFNTFYDMAVAAAILILGLFVSAWRLAEMPDQVRQTDSAAARLA